MQLLICLFLTTMAVSYLQMSVQADERSAAKRFEAAKVDEPSLIAFLKEMPKGGDLHVHGGGAIYAENALDAAIAQHLFYDQSSNQFTREDAPGRIPADKLLGGEAGQNVSRWLDAASMRGWHPGTESGHDHFFRSFSYMGSAGQALGKDDSNVELIKRAQSENEQYLEIMTNIAPQNAWNMLGITPPLDDPEAALKEMEPRLQTFAAMCKPFLDQRDADLAQRVGVTAPITGTQGPITVRYIFAASRLESDKDFFTALAAGMALMRIDKRVVGINILAPEDDPIARTHFDTQMRLLDALWKHFGHPNITLHAGELTLAISPLEPMRSRIRKSIEMGHAKRIGHGVSVAWEDDLPGLLREMKQKGIDVEICLTSNDAILGVTGDRHPFNLYRRAGVPVNINTDDEGVDRTNLTMEYVRAVRSYHLSYADVKTLARNSIEYSFLPGESAYRNHDYMQLRTAFHGVGLPNWKPSADAARLLATSEKMRVQVRLEQAFAKFEN